MKRFFAALCILLFVATVSVAGSGVRASVAPSRAVAQVGDVVRLAVELRTMELVGSYTCELSWDPAVLRYVGARSPEGWSAVVNALDAPAGRLRWAAANPWGASGRLVALDVTFLAVGPGRSAVDLGVVWMAGALTFHDLLPGVTVRDGVVTVSAPLRRRW